MPIQRPWMQDLGDEACAKCEAALAGRVSGLGLYEHVHRVGKIPRRHVDNRQWVRCTGWAVDWSEIPTWAFFIELTAAVAFARAGMEAVDLGKVEIRNAYTESILARGSSAPARRFLGLAAPVSRSLFNDRLLQSWLDRQLLHPAAVDSWAG